MITPVNNVQSENNQLYEIGYLLTPLLPEEQVSVLVENFLRAKISARGGKVLSNQEPKLIKLAYSMAKVLDNKKMVYREAYFGAIKFELFPDQIVALNDEWRRLVELIRFLVIKTTAEAGVRVLSPGPFAAEGQPVPVSMAEAKEAVTAAIDREIDELLTPRVPVAANV